MPLAHAFFAGFLNEIGKYEQAIKEEQKANLLAGASPEDAAAEAAELQKAFQTGGAKGYWQKKLESTLKWYKQAGGQSFPALELAMAHARVGDKDKSLEWLEKSYEERDGNITLVKCEPSFKILHGDRGFADLLRRIGLPD